MNVVVDGVTFQCEEELEQKEIAAYVARAKEQYPNVSRVVAELDGDEVSLHYYEPAEGFERIRRITGYLVGTLDRFNDAKRAKEHDRVKHSI